MVKSIWPPWIISREKRSLLFLCRHWLDQNLLHIYMDSKYTMHFSVNPSMSYYFNWLSTSFPLLSVLSPVYYQSILVRFYPEYLNVKIFLLDMLMCIKIYLLYEQIVLPIANRSLNMSKIKKKNKKQKKIITVF
jgi:hypothetical protein